MKDGFTEVYRIKRDDGDDVVIGCNKEPGEARRLIIDGADTERVFEGVATMASFCYGRGFVGDDDVNDMRWRLSGRCLGLFAASEARPQKGARAFVHAVKLLPQDCNEIESRAAIEIIGQLTSREAVSE